MIRFRQFITECSCDRSQHLAWGHRPDVSMQEDFDSHRYEHLRNLPHHDWAEHAEHEFSPEHTKEFKDHVHSILGGGMHLDNYKILSDGFNDDLRKSENHHESGHIIVPNGYDWNSRRHETGVPSKYRVMDAITSHSLPHDLTAYRGIYTSSGIHKMTPGTTFTDHGYTGTSLKKEIAVDFAREHHDEDNGDDDNIGGRVPGLMSHKAIAKIHIPAGTRGHFLDAMGGSHDHEQELALHRGTKFKVLGHSTSEAPGAHPERSPKTKVHVVHLGVVGQHPKPLVPKFADDSRQVTGVDKT